MYEIMKSSNSYIEINFDEGYFIDKRFNVKTLFYKSISIEHLIDVIKIKTGLEIQIR